MGQGSSQGCADGIRRLIPPVGLVLLLGSQACACRGGTHELLVNLKTDWASGIEFTTVRTQVLGSTIETREFAVASGDAWTDGVRVAEFPDVDPGNHVITVSLLDASGGRIQDRNTIAHIRGSTLLTVIMTRDCAGVTCPVPGGDPRLGACVGGTCTDPHCSPETPELCPTECVVDRDCPASSACVRPRCDTGVCFQVADPDACGVGNWCDPEVGCVPLPVLDAGAGDAGTDAGPTDAGPWDAASDTGVRDAGVPDAPPRPVALTVGIRGDGSGTLESTPPGVRCPDFCTDYVLPGTTVTLTFAPGVASVHEGWDHPDCPDKGPCTVTVTAPMTVRALVTRRNLVFVSSTVQPPGDFTSLADADALCNSLAGAQGLPGDYVAWLADAGTPIRDRLGSARGWLRFDFIPFADTVDDILNGRIVAPVWFDETGNPGPTDLVATGIAPDGSTSALSNCFDGTGTLLGYGHRSGSEFTSATGRALDCMTARPIYCFGIDLARPVEVTPVPGRLAFVSSPWSPGLGVADADATCQGEAAAAGLPGTFRALLGGPGSSPPSSRFDLAGPPWVRLDGVPIVKAAADWGPGGPGVFWIPLNLALDGRFVDTAVWLGTWAPGMSVGETHCLDWTSTSPSLQGSPVSSNATVFGAPAGLDPSCAATGHRLFCLEE